MTDFSVRDISVGTHVGAGTALIAGTAPVGAAEVGDTAKFTGNVSWEGAGEGALQANAFQVVSIAPTIYPPDPRGTITVQNYITINVHSPDFREFEKKMDEVLDHLRTSNEIAGEVRDKLVAEMKAGMAIVKSPKPDRGMIDLLLIRPLKWIAEKAAGATIAAIASEAMKALLRWMTGGVG